MQPQHSQFTNDYRSNIEPSLMSDGFSEGKSIIYTNDLSLASDRSRPFHSGRPHYNNHR